jgi:hypothetical protein
MYINFTLYLLIALSIFSESVRAQDLTSYFETKFPRQNGTLVSGLNVDLYQGATKIYDLTETKLGVYSHNTISTGEYDVWVGGALWKSGVHITSNKVTLVVDVFAFGSDNVLTIDHVNNSDDVIVIPDSDTNNDGEFIVRTGGSDRFKVENTGRVLITNNASGDDLKIVNTGTAQFTVEGTAAETKITSSGGSGYVAHTSNGLELYNNSSGNTKITITNSGIGVNTTSPDEVFHVNDTVKAVAFKGDGSQLTGISTDESVFINGLSFDSADSDTTIDISSHGMTNPYANVTATGGWPVFVSSISATSITVSRGLAGYGDNVEFNLHLIDQ